MTELDEFRDAIETSGVGAELQAMLRKRIVEILHAEDKIRISERTQESQILISLIAEFLAEEGLEFSKSVLATEAGFDFLEISEIAAEQNLPSKNILKNVWKNATHAEYYDTGELLTTLGISRSQLVDIAILAGCDFASKISNVGIATAVKAIKTHGSIEEYFNFRRQNDRDWNFYQFDFQAFDYVRGRENYNRQVDT